MRKPHGPFTEEHKQKLRKPHGPMSEEQKQLRRGSNSTEVKKIKKDAQNRPEVKEKKSKSQKIASALPEVKERQSIAQKEAQNRPEVKEKKSISHKKNWQDSEFAQAMVESQSRKPTKPEQFWSGVLPERYPELEWEYTGAGTFWINGKNPDFVSKKYKLAIEYNGGYFHRDDIPGAREAIFAEWGWRTFIIVDIEMMDMEKLYKRLDEFITREIV